MTEKKTRISRLKVALATVAISAVLVVPVGATEHTEGASVTVEGGTFDLALTEVTALNSAAALTYDPNDQTAAGTLNVNVSDYTGDGAGWDVTMVANNFQPDGWVADDPEIAASNLVVDTYGTINVTDGTDTGVSTGVTSTGLDTAQSVVTATSDYEGGELDVDANLELTVPGGTPPDTYNSTITVDEATYAQ